MINQGVPPGRSENDADKSRTGCFAKSGSRLGHSCDGPMYYRAVGHEGRNGPSGQASTKGRAYCSGRGTVKPRRSFRC